MQASRRGVRGREELGGGFAALFVLENGFDLNTGSLARKNRGSKGLILLCHIIYLQRSDAW